jgi:dephospho-CoA kinase
MKTIGLTGGIGMGKSAATEILRSRGVPVVDTDLLARELTQPGQAALEEIQRLFGPAVLDSQGRLRRDELARRVFSKPNERGKLERVLHPRIRAAWQSQLANWRAGSRPLAVVAIPLLFETGAQAEFDATLCVACSAATQLSRLAARGWSPEHIQQRIRAQWPIDRKMAASDYLVWTDGPLAVHAAQLDRVLASVAITPAARRRPAAGHAGSHDRCNP